MEGQHGLRRDRDQEVFEMKDILTTIAVFGTIAIGIPFFMAGGLFRLACDAFKYGEKCYNDFIKSLND